MVLCEMLGGGCMGIILGITSWLCSLDRRGTPGESSNTCPAETVQPKKTFGITIYFHLITITISSGIWIAFNVQFA